MDEQIGRLVEALDARDPGGDTVLAVVADHGEGLGDHDWWTHGILDQEQIHVPLIIKAPGTDQRSEIDELISTVDLAPTLLDLAGVASPLGVAFDGRSFARQMHGEP
jgi:arylsulfatase A-like enzyme